MVEADKNLGGAILDRSVYISRGIKEHLGNTAVYQRLTKQQAYGFNNILRYRMGIFVSKYRTQLTPAETDYLYKSMLRFPDKLARFRMSLKAHKNPWKMQPIVCCAGTFINCLSKWLDYWLQPPVLHQKQLPTAQQHHRLGHTTTKRKTFHCRHSVNVHQHQHGPCYRSD
mmetsp:Transcript_18789/g.39385  ORF Transcript_18789/g.39385 Transcript_18789/m.39385 type:complete len:170 (+) Transcript_18789:1884-2393(+)